MAKLPDLVARIRLDTSQLDAAMGTVEKKVGDVGSKLKGLGVVAGGVAAAGVVRFGAGAVKAFGDSQKAAAQTAAVIKSTGGAANVSAKDISNLSGRLQELSGVEDEAIQAGQNMLLTFTGIRNEAGKGNDVFDQATKTLLDMSVALGTDAKTTAIQLGKALNDPIKGISALTRVGVTFTAEQKATIQTMVDMGDKAGAQKVILAELNREFGGSAKAAGDARTPMEKLSLQFGEIQEKLGSVLLPALAKLTDVLLGLINFFSSLPTPVLVFIGVVAGLTVAVLAVSKAIEIFKAVQLALNVVLFANPIGLVVAGVAALGVALFLAYQKSETFRNVVKGAFEIVLVPVRALKDVVEAIVEAFVAAIRLAARLAKAIPNLPSLPKGLNKVPGIPFLAHGGTARAGRAHIVGEDGPELFIPRVTGTVLPRVPAGVGGTTVQVIQNVNGELSPYMLSVLKARAADAANAVSTTLALNSPVRR